MTIIAAYAIRKFPMLFGDLLLTGRNDPSAQKVAVPAQGEVQEFFGSSGWGISGLNQKVTIIGDNCVVAWAGTWLGAKVAIAKLRELASSSTLTCEAVLNALHAEPDLKHYPASFVGLIHEDGVLQQFRFNAEHFQNPSLGTVYLSGTGSAAIHEFSQMLAGADSRMTGSPNGADVAIAQSLMLGGLLLQSEFRGGDAATTLRHMFGGGYEIAFYSEGRMQKLSEVTYVFWEALVTAHDVQLSHPQLLVKQKYAGDFLLIRSARVESSATSLRVVDEQRHVIRPMYESAGRPTQQDLADVSLQSRLQCHCILVKRGTEAIGIYTRIQRYSPDSEVSVTCEDKNGHLVFGFREDTMAEILHALERFRDERT